MTSSEVIEAIERIRNIDCFELHFCYKPHGTAVAVYLGSGPRKKLICCRDSIGGALKKTLRHLKKTTNQCLKPWLLNERFGHLRVVEYIGGDNQDIWVCLCDCGRYIRATEKELKDLEVTRCNMC